MAELTGAQVVARALITQGVEVLYGVTGIPVIPIPSAAQKAGLRYIGTRHEQAAGFAAQATGYLTGRIGAALCVTGPGLTNMITALGNARANCWPMLLIAGASTPSLDNRGDFQEAPQLEAVRPFVKWAGDIETIQQIPRYLAQAVREAINGRPGPTYVQLPGDVVNARADEAAIPWEPRVPDPPRRPVSEESIAAAIAALQSAGSPLLIIGKGAAWARAEGELREFVDKTQMPFLPTPMGKGVVPDDHPLSAAAARTFALQNADLVFLVGARLNWQLHFGLPPRFRPKVRVIHLEIEPSEIGRNVPTEAALVGDARTVMGQINHYLDAHPWQLADATEWKAALRAESERKQAATRALASEEAVPMNYYRPLQEIQNALPRDAIIVAEGANTMDISRQVLGNYQPRSRLDAGTWGTMGVGPGFALAAQTTFPDRRVVVVSGDAAFGFDGLEVETAARHRLPITWIIINNNGIYGGVTELDPNRPVPPAVLLPGARYERLAEAFGSKGYFCQTPAELRRALKDALGQAGPTVINVAIDPSAGRRKQQFDWVPTTESVST